MSRAFSAEQCALARRLRRLRGENGFTQQQVAGALRVKREVVAEIERGNRSVTAPEAYRLARLYDVTLDELLAGVGRAGRDPGQPSGRVRPLKPAWWPRRRKDMGTQRA
jgi:transcriptional regulator with XRE-family HTH domain